MKGVGAGSRVFELLDRTPAIPTETGVALSPKRNGNIRLENISFAYPSRLTVPVLQGVNMDIEVGTSVAIVGPSGRCVLSSRRFPTVVGLVWMDGFGRRAKETNQQPVISLKPPSDLLLTHRPALFGMATTTNAIIVARAQSMVCS